MNVVVFLNLAKIFDTVNHDILINKLTADGVRSTSLIWFQSYLSKHRQKCCVNEILLKGYPTRFNTWPFITFYIHQ